MNGNKIRQKRLEKGFSQTQLAEMMGADRSYINKIENNHKKPSISFLENLASKLGCSIRDFF